MNEDWEDRVTDQLWKHVDPLEIGLGSGDINEVNLEDYCSKPCPNKRRRLDDNVGDQRRNTAKWRILKARQREASRPIYQFAYQVCKEREWLLVGLSSEEISGETNIDAVAHEAVRRRWIEQRFWDSAWSYIPGTSWRHERPRKFPLKDRQLDEQQAAENSLDPPASPPSYRIIPHKGYPQHSVCVPPQSGSNIFGNQSSNQRTWTSETHGDEPLVSPYDRAR
ncbi:hypothetical protein N7G274_003190 [Stereocaulon virgatum]|uniref:Uncharacterized protein n=1 Tax=Stereocaulon virgatum TaxID=373712 RepID=A0ABR4AGB8_9LECA